jgi:hypothetical protein
LPADRLRHAVMSGTALDPPHLSCATLNQILLLEHA